MLTRYLRPGLSLLFAITLIVGLIYPFALAGIAKLAMGRQAQGSLLYENGALMGSELIGQNFTDPKYFWGRPSATTPQPYNGINSGGSNFGPLNPALIDKVQANAKALHDADPSNKALIPVELVTASMSGLDPEISPAAAWYQAARVARARNMPIAKVRALIEAHQRNPIFGVIGEPVVNVLALNLDLDEQH
jgi:potassium-transporting ATPase KdpC subunit